MKKKKPLHNEKQKHAMLHVKIVTASGMQKAVIDASGVVKIYVKSAPEKGQANQELVHFLAKKFDVPRSAITIVTGATSRTKMLKILTDLTTEQLFNKLKQ